MLAFWLLAAVAAMITGLGLHDGGSTVTVRAGSPSPVSRGGSPELVLGGVLHATPAVTPAVTADATTGSPAGALPDVSAVFVARPAVVIRAHSAPRPAVAPKPRKVVRSSTPRSQPTTTAPARATVAPTAPAPTRPGHGHHAGSDRGPTRTKVVATSLMQVHGHPSPHGHGPSGHGKSGH
jgi:hypothetical protein